MIKAKSHTFCGLSWNLNIFSGPKGVMKCGKCFICSTHRLPLINNPVLKCPHCGEANQISSQYGLF